MKIIFLILPFILISTRENKNLIFVMTHFRHGARSPTHLDSKNLDLLGEEWDKEGALTGVGKRMQYLLGYRNRLRYVDQYNFLSEKYNSTEIKVVSSYKERAQESILAHLQGLYPPNKNLGETLNEKQINNADPPVNIEDPEIDREKIELGNNTLPNSMTIIPFESIDISSNKSCRGEGTDNSSNIIAVVNKFNELYLEKFSEFINSDNQNNYTFEEVGDICSDYICSYVDGRSMTTFSEFIDLDEFYNFCMDAFLLKVGETKVTSNITEYAFGTYFMRLLVDFTKLKVDEDIGKSESSSINPKMLIISGHDTSMSTHQFFLQFALGKSMDFFRTTTFTSQMAFEIERNNDDKTDRDYSDYFISYYFNDELLLNMTLDEFFNKVEPHILSDEEINSICNFDTDSDGDKENSQSNSTIKYKIITNNKYHIAPLIVFASLFGVSLLVNVFLIYKLFKRISNPIPNQNINLSEVNKQV